MAKLDDPPLWRNKVRSIRLAKSIVRNSIWIALGFVLCGLILRSSRPVNIHYEKPEITEQQTTTPPAGFIGPIQPPYCPVVEDPAIVRLRAYFEITNPSMVKYAGYLVYQSRHYGVDPYLVVAIGVLESGNFRSSLCSYGNCWGINSSSGYVQFGSMYEGIDHATKLLASSRYAGKTIEQIGPIYAEDATWSWKVRAIYEEVAE
ncbi:glucosaminidase domain-containing protein [candidate division WWE3 bacterium]|uniref:Glucosaminidase domain-containing protein n=1 Tax=candidate division WWE3 bacterium TaxID=2053526 RepID=A0A955LL89_UNCKA|nr:glucosaminidase domain-containing protein [candidate division WWE3 bacterium]